MTDKIEDGGSAFPLPITISPMGDEHIAYQGMTLRDYFAAKAMQGLLACGIECGPNDVPHVAESAYILADAMLRARAKSE